MLHFLQRCAQYPRRYRRTVLTVCSLALAAMPGIASAQTINFDELPASSTTVPTIYFGLYWNSTTDGGLTLLGPASYVTNDPSQPCHSGLSCAVNPHLSGIVVRSATNSVADEFTFSAWLAGSGLMGVHGASTVRARGYTNGSTVPDFTLDILLGGANWNQIDFTNHLFNYLSLTPVDANGNDYKQDDYQSVGTMLLDDVTLSKTLSVPPTQPGTTVPEPGSMLLVAAGLGLVGLTARQRRSRTMV